MTRYLLETYGCTANRGESMRIEESMRDAGHRRVESAQVADVAILNTCTVTETTEDNMVRRAAELDGAVEELIVTGCLALAQPDRLAQAGVNARVVGWDDVPTAVRNGECPTPENGVEPALLDGIGILPIARGCASDCSYCITKHATGRIESPPIEDNVERARALIEAGAHELRITGQDTGVYGWDQGERWLPDLLARICSLEGDFRVRLGMANPKGVHMIRDRLVEVFAAYDELYNFIHAPVQSGSNDVLADMRRQHQVREFLEVVDAFDGALDEWTLSTDFIVGFPSETGADHEASMELLRTVRPEKINVTRFSKRPNTDAAAMKGLGGTVKKERSKAMSALKREICTEVYADMVGSQREVLVVEAGTGDSLKCRDQAYRQVIIRNGTAHDFELGDFVEVEITSHESMYCFGEPV